MSDDTISVPESTDTPLVAELPPFWQPSELFQKLSHLKHCLFLDSALRHDSLGRYSFVAADPFAFTSVPADSSDALGQLELPLRQMRASTVPGLPPFQGGAAGLLAYDLGRSLEQIPIPRFDEFQVPAMAVGFYDVVFAFDHVMQRAWLVSQGFPETEPLARRDRAEARLRFFQAQLTRPAQATFPADKALRLDELSAQHLVGGTPDLYSNFTAKQYDNILRRAIEYICCGDIFQVNIAQRLLYPARSDPVTLYLRLRERNRAPFAGYFDLGTHQIVSASPERFLQIRDRLVETRPIKGTRQRSRNPVADLYSAGDLLESEKDRAENVMIVDLLRNDLSRVCLPESVQVTQLCGLETYEFVQHLVSVIQGELDPGKTPIDAIRAAFPGGSITGAPKVRAMEIISELEPNARGAYCGSMGYIGFDGSMDLSILIRTITVGRGWWQMPVGGGIVAQSDPQLEYEETWQKAVGLLRALT
jgi:para-aminobenzoate synthetase component 1